MCNWWLVSILLDSNSTYMKLIYFCGKHCLVQNFVFVCGSVTVCFSNSDTKNQYYGKYLLERKLNFIMQLK